MTHTPHIQRADPRTRAVALWTVLIGAALSAALLWLAARWSPDVRAWITSDPAAMRTRARLLLTLTGAALIVPLVAFAGYLWWLGQRIQEALRFPPPAMKVLRDTPVLVGPAAEARGRLVKGFGVAVVILSLGLLVALNRLAAIL